MAAAENGRPTTSEWDVVARVTLQVTASEGSAARVALLTVITRHMFKTDAIF